MSFEEAAQLINEIKPQVAVPIHYGSVVGTKQDAIEKFKNLKKIQKMKKLHLVQI